MAYLVTHKDTTPRRSPWTACVRPKLLVVEGQDDRGVGWSTVEDRPWGIPRTSFEFFAADGRRTSCHS